MYVVKITQNTVTEFLKMIRSYKNVVYLLSLSFDSYFLLQ